MAPDGTSPGNSPGNVHERRVLPFGGGFGNEAIIRQHYPTSGAWGTMVGSTTLPHHVVQHGHHRYPALQELHPDVHQGQQAGADAFALMFSAIFSVLYESWLTGSLNPFTIMLLIVMTMMSEEEIIGHQHASEEEEGGARGPGWRAPAPTGYGRPDLSLSPIMRRRTLFVIVALLLLLVSAWIADRELKARRHPGLLAFMGQVLRNYPPASHPTRSCWRSRSMITSCSSWRRWSKRRGRGVIIQEGTAM